MELVQLVYHSRPNINALGAARLAAFRDIHASAVKANNRNGVTGFLIFTQNHFAQILEGDRSVVMATYDRIKQDKRHTDPTVLDITPCRSRQFQSWAMGAVHDKMAIQEAMLGIGIGGELDIPSMHAKQITALLRALTDRQNSAAA
jgi:hypothetical protein